MTSTDMIHWVQPPKSLDYEYIQRFVDVFWNEIAQLKIVSSFKNLTNLSKFVIVLAIFSLRFIVS